MFRFRKISAMTKNPVPPIMKSNVIIILSVGSPTHLLKLSGSKPNPALLKAEIEWNMP